MSRRILFKAKRIDNGEWIEGNLKLVTNFLLDNKDGRYMYYIIPKNTDRSVLVSSLRSPSYEVDPSTIRRYTGLTDKNSSKIWENDIIACYLGENIVAPIKYGIYKSPFDNAHTEHYGFYVDWPPEIRFRKDLSYWINTKKARIVGNVFDNPELLEDAK